MAISRERVGYAVLTGTALSFLGAGARPPTPEWGQMVAASRNYLPGAWWPSLFPGVAIFVTVVSFNLLGDGLRDYSRKSDARSPSYPGVSVQAPVVDLIGLAVDFHTGDGVEQVIKDVTLRIDPGEIVGLVGESGCGKSVTAKLLLGIRPCRRPW